MPKIRTSRRVPAHRRSTRQASARLSVSRQHSESPEQRELRADRERLRPLEDVNALLLQNPQVGSFTDSLLSPSHFDGLGMDMFPEDHLQFPDDLTLANLNNGGPVGGSSMPPTTSLQLAGSQTHTTEDGEEIPSWALPQPNLTGFALPFGGRTAGQIAYRIYGMSIRIDTALCKKLATEFAMREPVQRRPETSLNMGRRSNVEALLGYVTGVPVRRACKNCAKGHGPWHHCVILEGQLCGSCTNCWFNASGSRCTFHETNQANATFAPTPAWNAGSNAMALLPSMMQDSATLAQPTLSFTQPSPSQQSSSFPQTSPLPMISSAQQPTYLPSLPSLSVSQATSFNNALQPAHQPSTPQPSPPAYTLPSRLNPSN